MHQVRDAFSTTIPARKDPWRRKPILDFQGSARLGCFSGRSLAASYSPADSPYLKKWVRNPLQDSAPFRRFDLFGRWMRRRELRHAQRDNNRVVRQFEWGAEFIADHVNGDDPRLIFREHTTRVMAYSENFYELPVISDY